MIDEAGTDDQEVSSGILRDTENALVALRVAIRENKLDPKLFSNVTDQLYSGITSQLKVVNIAKGDATAKELIREFEMETGKAIAKELGRPFP